MSSVAYGDYIPGNEPGSGWGNDSPGGTEVSSRFCVRKMLTGSVAITNTSKNAFTLYATPQDLSRFFAAVRSGEFDEFVY